MSPNRVVDLRGKRERSPDSAQPRLPMSPRKFREPLRAKRRRRRFIAFLALFPLVISLAWGVSYVSYLPQFNVGTVSVRGTDVVPARLVKDLAETKLYPGTHPFLSQDNVFLFSESNLAKAVAAYFPRIKTVTVTRASMMATAAMITVVERTPYALWCSSLDASSTDCYQMDQDGVIFAPGSTASSTVASTYVFEGGLVSASSTKDARSPIGQTFSPGHMPGLISFLQLLQQQNLEPQTISVQNDQDFTISLAQGYFLKASFGEDPQELVRNLKLTLNSIGDPTAISQLEYIDLRFGDRVYYKVRGKDQTSSASSTSS